MDKRLGKRRKKGNRVGIKQVKLIPGNREGEPGSVICRQYGLTGAGWSANPEMTSGNPVFNLDKEALASKYPPSLPRHLVFRARATNGAAEAEERRSFSLSLCTQHQFP
jgi:hypothetical protein